MGPAAAEISKSLGAPFMPWQEYVADVALEIDPLTGLPAYREIWITVPRQSGKTTWILAICVHRALGWGSAQRIVYAAQTRNDARKKWEDDQTPILRKSPLGRMMRVRRGNGQEAFIWKNGSLHGITSNTEKSGHGPTLDLGVIDEAFAQEDNRLEQAFRPSMVTRPAAQIVGCSTAGWKGGSPFLAAKVRMGRAIVERGERSGIAYFEWSVPEDWDLSDPATWRACMPALGYTISESTVAADLMSARESDEGVAGFQRSMLNIWVPKMKKTPALSAYAWKACTDHESQIVGPLAFGVDSTPERTHTAIGVYGERGDGLAHVEVVDHHDATAWVIPRVIDLQKWGPCATVIDPSSAAGAFIRPLRDAGVDVMETSARDVVQAAGTIYDKIVAGSLRHRGQSVLTRSVGAAQKRNLADAWTWDRRFSTDDISPLVSITLAEHGFAASEVDDEYDPLESVQ